MKNMKKPYEAPMAEVVAFAQEDVITSSGNIFDWETPPVDVGNDGNGDFNWGNGIWN